MDTPITKKNKYKVKHLFSGLAIIGLSFLVYFSFFKKYTSTFRVKMNELQLGIVKYDKFNDYISLNGVVSPITTVYLNAFEGGRVVSINKEEGEMVNKNDVILILENQSLYEEILNSENNLATKQNNLRDTKLKFETNRILGRKNTIHAKHNYKQAKRKFEQSKSLFNEGLIARELFLQDKEQYELSEKELDITLFQIRQDSILQITGISDLDKDLIRMKKTLSLVYDRINRLKVTAPIGGQLGQLDAQIGQQIGKGAQIGQIHVLDDYKITAQVSEFYLDKVKKGLEATFVRQADTFKLQLKKIYPEVRGGEFKVDFEFVNKRPQNITTGQSYFLKLQLAAPKKALLISKGAFMNTTGGTWMYVLDKQQKYAYKRFVKLGKQNPEYYEVLDGLEINEQVILSNYDAFGENEQLIIN